MADNGTRWTPAELPKIRNAQALGYLHHAAAYLALASAAFEACAQEQHQAITDQVLDTCASLTKQVSK